MVILRVTAGWSADPGRQQFIRSESWIHHFRSGYSPVRRRPPVCRRRGSSCRGNPGGCPDTANPGLGEGRRGGGRKARVGCAPPGHLYAAHVVRGAVRSCRGRGPPTGENRGWVGRPADGDENGQSVGAADCSKDAELSWLRTWTSR